MVELHFTPVTQFLIAPVLTLHLPTSRSTSGCDFPSTPTSCSSVHYTIPLTVTTPSTSLSDSMGKLLTTHPNSLFLMCGAFSCHHANCLGVGTSVTSHGTSAKDFCDSMKLTQSVNFATQISLNGKSSLLDLVMTNFPANVSCSLSDHMFVKANVSLAILRELPQC